MSDQGGQRAKKAALWLLQKAVELAAVTLGVYALAALAALNVPAFLACVLLKNTLLGLWFALEYKKPPQCWNTGTAKAVKFAAVTASIIHESEENCNEV